MNLLEILTLGVNLATLALVAACVVITIRNAR